MTILGRGDWTEEHHALIEGNAQVDAYLIWSENIYFQYPGQEPQPAITGRYRVADTRVFLDALEKHTPGGSGLMPGDLLDKNGKRFTVMRPSSRLFGEDQSPEAVDFDLDDFSVEIMKSVRVQKRTGSTAILVGRFLDEYPDKGGSLEFIAWAKKHPDVISIEHGGKITWKDPALGTQVRETKTVTNAIQRWREERQKQ